MKVTKVTTNSGETSVSIDLFEGLSLSKEQKEQVAETVGTFLVEQTLLSVAESKSPVKGESIPALARGPYRDKKQEELGTTRADLQFSGETLDELNFITTKDGIKLGVFGDRAPVADGHNNLSGKSQLTRRRFLPGEGQVYRGDIQKEVDRIVADAIAENVGFKKRDFSGVTTQRQLLEVLKSKFGPMSKNELSLTVYRNEDLLDLLKELDLLNLVP